MEERPERGRGVRQAPEELHRERKALNGSAIGWARAAP
jgi:hypothetical protein